MRYWSMFAVVILSVVYPCPSQAELFFSLDQANVVSSSSNRNIGVQPYPRQSFVPALTKINRVDLRLADAGAEIGNMGDVEVRLYSGAATTPLATSSSITLSDGTAGYVDFDYVTFEFDQEISINPGFQYRIEAVNTTTGGTAGNFMWTAGQGDSYSRGTSFNGPSSGADFLFRTGLVQENRLDLVPQTIGSITQPLPTGTRTTSPSALISDVSAPSAPSTATLRQTRAIAEYDLAELVGRSDLMITSAILAGEIYKNNSIDSGDREIEISMYEGDNQLSISDYDINSSQLFTTSYRTESSVAFSLDVKDQLAGLLASGGEAFGIRFRPLNYQASSVLSASTPPLLTITVVAVPEPTSF
ncbi:MAG: hypothetical protein WBD31_16215, partial [Rubripirellula sp.]